MIKKLTDHELRAIQAGRPMSQAIQQLISDRIALVQDMQSLEAERSLLAFERDTYRTALRTIRDQYGKVCSGYELCEHAACASSYGAWATADEALRTIDDPDVPGDDVTDKYTYGGHA